MIRLRVVKWVAIVGTFLLVSLLLIVAFTPTILRSAWAKSQVVAFLRSALGAEVEIEGPIVLDLGMSPEIAVTGVRIEFPDGASTIRDIRAGELRVAAPILANIRGRRTIDRVSLRDAAVRLITAKSGGEPAASPPTETSASSPSLPVLQHLEVTNVKVSIEGNPSVHEVDITRIAGDNLNGDGEGKLSAELSVDGEPVKLSVRSGSLNSFLSGAELPIVLDAGYGGSRLGIKGNIRSNGNLAIRVDASGSGTSTLARLAGGTVPELGPFRIVADLRLEKGDSQSIRLSDLDLRVRERQITGRVAVDIGPRGATKADVELVSGSDRLSTKGTVGADGGVTAEVKLSSSDLSALAPLLGVRLPPYRNVIVAGRLSSKSIDRGVFKVENLDLHVGASDLTGAVDLSLKPLRVDATLESKVLDLVELTQTLAGKDSEAGRSAPSAKGGDEPRIPYDALAAMDGDIRVKVGILKTPFGLGLDGADLGATLKAGNLTITQVAAQVFGGSFSGNGQFSRDGVRLHFSAHRFGASPMMLLAGGQPFITGDFDFSIDLHGRGETVSELTKSLNGAMSLSSENAHVESSTLDTADSGLSRILAPVFGESGKAKSECLLVSYDVKNGIATSRELVVQLGEVFLFGTGRLDIPNQELAYNFNVNSSSPALASLVPPFRAYGKVSNPRFVPSVSGSIASVADSAEGVFDTTTGFFMKAGRLIGVKGKEELKGLELCRETYRVERHRISSLVGNAVSGGAEAPEVQKNSGAIEATDRRKVPK